MRDPSITSLPRGYDCTIAPPVSRLAATLADGTATVDYRFRVFAGGKELAEQSGFVAYAGGEVVDEAPVPRHQPAGDLDLSLEATLDEGVLAAQLALDLGLGIDHRDVVFRHSSSCQIAAF